MAYMYHDGGRVITRIRSRMVERWTDCTNVCINGGNGGVYEDIARAGCPGQHTGLGE